MDLTNYLVNFFFNSPEVSTYYYDLWLSLSFVVMYLIQPHFVNSQLLQIGVPNRFYFV